MMLPLYSAGFAALALTFYAVLDGFDLGVGTLLLFQSAKASRDHMIDTITPTWDGNETWLVMAGVTLFAAFPIAYGVLLPALYLPIILMLLALGLRGVSFEFRVQMRKYQSQWDLAFAVGSVIAAFMQGLILGSVLQGVKTQDLRFAGSVLDVLRPLPIISGITLVVGYAVLGSAWLHLKANTILRRFAIRTLRVTSIAFGTLFCISCVYASKVQPGIQAAWGAHPIALSILVSLFVLLAGSLAAISGKSGALLLFVMGLSLFVVGMAGIAIIIYPNIVPFQISLWDAAASAASQRFLLVGATVVTPVILTYSAFAYWVFRGRTPAKGWGE